MIYIIFSLFYFFKKNKSIISTLLVILLIFTSLASYLVGRQPGFDIASLIFTFYVAVLLYMLFNAYSCYSKPTTIQIDFSLAKLHLVEKITSFFGIFIILIDIYIIYKVLGLLTSHTITVEEYKNQGGVSNTITIFVPYIFMTLSNFMSPLGYFFLSMHFFYLTRNNIKKGIKYILLSSLYILPGLISLSRSATVEFIMVYGIMFLYFSPLINKKVKRVVIKTSSIVFVIIFITLFSISSNRFSNYYTKNSKNESVINEKQNPLLFSSLDYFAQWEENSIVILDNHKFNMNSWGLYNCSGLVVHIQKMIFGAKKINNERLIKYNKIFGDQRTKFHGLIARLVYDFGFLGALIFVFLLVIFTRSFRPINGVISLKQYLSLPLILPIYVMFWTGNALSSLNQNIGIIYVFIIYIFVKSNLLKNNN